VCISAYLRIQRDICRGSTARTFMRLPECSTAGARGARKVKLPSEFEFRLSLSQWLPSEPNDPLRVCMYVMLCYVMVPLLPPVNCVEDSWGVVASCDICQYVCMHKSMKGVGVGEGSDDGVQGVAGNKKGEFEVEAQFLSKLHTNNG
jgi:hypothetical protein